MSGAPKIKPIAGHVLYVRREQPDADHRGGRRRTGTPAPAASGSRRRRSAGPWAVATNVPASIYSIPPSSPLYYVTYVQVYDATAETVVIGYTPGYMGTVVSSDGVVVYGTGYDYPAYISSTRLVSAAGHIRLCGRRDLDAVDRLGRRLRLRHDDGRRRHRLVRRLLGAMPYAYAWGADGAYAYHGVAYGAYGGAAAWGPGGWAATSGNMYHQYGATSAVTRSSAGYNAWTGNAWSSKVGTLVQLGDGANVGGAVGLGGERLHRQLRLREPRGDLQPEHRRRRRRQAAPRSATPTRASRPPSATPRSTVPAARPRTCSRSTTTTTPRRTGTSTRATASGFQQYNSNGGWSNVSHDATNQSLSNQAASQMAADQRASGSSWGGGSSWDGGGGGGGGAGGAAAEEAVTSAGAVAAGAAVVAAVAAAAGAAEAAVEAGAWGRRSAVAAASAASGAAAAGADS